MWKFLRIAILSTVLFVPFSGDRTSPALAQEHQGCFLIDFDGVLVDLSEICPVPEQLQVSAPAGGEPQLGTGDIQVTLRWSTLDDLDLAVTDPNGEIVAYYNRAVPSGGQLDVDANAGCAEQNSSPIENIFWPPSQAPQGNYTVTVNLFARCGNSSGPVPFNLTLLVQGNTETLTGTVDDQNPNAVFPFSLPR
ncbi:hypothetical protein C7B61_03470 [filamentous cyanobacterium CCP1]|nr:hypothetical protein C7B76_06270 [filamentous cyanobacterium CCP2]PSB67948.1 hypothetical protein C7B61_03470 [filamentous cyanobacterium CCP1]